MTRAGRPSRKTKPVGARRGPARFPVPAAGGAIYPVPEYNAAHSYSNDDLHHAIEATGGKPVPDLDIDLARSMISTAVFDFVTAWSMRNVSPPGETMSWAREVRKRARAFLEIMHVDPDNAWSISTPAGHKVRGLLISHLPPFDETVEAQPIVFEDGLAFEIRRRMGEAPIAPDDAQPADTENHNYYGHASRAIDLGLLGATYAARLSGARAEHDNKRKGRTRKADVPLVQLVEDINRVYGLIFGDEGTVVTSAYYGHARTGRAIDFTQAIMRSIAKALPEQPSTVEFTGMRDAVRKLVGSRTVTANRIRQARSKKWQGGN